ncbi:hypothetical protein B0H12DRAFT_1242778 [Mycena haematopus]|nr:hypothetical protein B0H12DRAFT_1242778 [Mycena haematopus]
MTTNAGSHIDARASALYPNLDMEFPSLLLSTYGAEISFDLNISTITMPGVAVAGKLVIVQISKELIVLMVGVIGHKKPLFCLADWSTTKTEVEANTRSVVIHLVECSPAGSFFQVNGGIVQSCQPGVKLRIVLANQAAFWALAYLILKSSSTVAPPTVFSFDAQYRDHVMGMFEFFEADAGREVCTGDGVCEPSDDHPPGYTGDK